MLRSLGYSCGNSMKESCRGILPVVFMLLLCSCSLPVQELPVPVDPGSTLHLYLHPIPQEAETLTLTIASINAVTKEGHEIALLKKPVEINGKDKINLQSKLATRKLPTGSYRGLSVTLSKAILAGEQGPFDLLVDNRAQLIEHVFRVRAEKATTLSLSLQPERLVTDGYRLTGGLSLWSSQPPLTELKGIVSHPQEGTLSLFEKKKQLVYSVLAAGQTPSAMALDQNERRVYVALKDADAIIEIDLSHDQIEGKINLRPTDRPSDLALSDDGLTLLVANSGSNSVSIIDTNPFRERGRLLFSSRPQSIFYGSHPSRAYVVLPDVMSLALIDTDREEIDLVSVLPEIPLEGCIDPNGDKLLMLAEASSDLLVVDARTLNFEKRIHVGFGAKRVVAAQNSLFYIALDHGEIVVIDPDFDLSLDQFRASGPVRDLALDTRENSLYVITGKMLEKYDAISKKLLGSLDLGAVGEGISIMGEP